MKILSMLAGILLLVVSVAAEAQEFDKEASSGVYELQAKVHYIDKIPVLHISTQPESFDILIFKNNLVMPARDRKTIFYLASDNEKGGRIMHAGRSGISFVQRKDVITAIFDTKPGHGIIQDGGGNDILRSFSEVSGLTMEITGVSCSIKLENIEVEIFEGLTRATDGTNKIEEKIGVAPPALSDLGIELIAMPAMLRMLGDQVDLTKVVYVKQSDAIAKQTKISYPTLFNIVGMKLPELVVDRDNIDVALLKTTVGEVVVGEEAAEPDPKSLELEGKITIGTGDVKIRLIDSDAGIVEALDREFQLQLMRSSIGAF